MSNQWEIRVLFKFFKKFARSFKICHFTNFFGPLTSRADKFNKPETHANITMKNTKNRNKEVKFCKIQADSEYRNLSTPTN